MAASDDRPPRSPHTAKTVRETAKADMENRAATRIQTAFRAFRQRRAERLRDAPTVAVQFQEHDRGIGGETRARVLHQMGSLYGVNAVETDVAPNVTVNIGSRDVMKEAVLAEPARTFVERASRAVRSSGFVETPEQPQGTARGVTNRIGGDRVYLNADRLTSPADVARTAIHEIGHALGLEHPADPTTHNIMQPAETGQQRQRTTTEQRTTTQDFGRAKEVQRTMALRRAGAEFKS